MFYLKISRSNSVNKFATYSNALFCVLFFTYFIIYSRFNQIPKFNIIINTQKNESTTSIPEKISNSTKPPMKYILLWTSPKKSPFVYFGEGNQIFVNKSCHWTNCYVTSDRNFLGAYTEFEVIAFNGPQLPMMIYNRDWPKERHAHQKYVFVNVESAANYAIRSIVFNGYFNWTWTYKLNSDAYWGYFVIRDAEDKVVGPKTNMSWIMPWNMDPIDKDYFNKLKSKSRAAAWMCSSKESSSRRELFVQKLQHRLRKYKLKVDIFGQCGDHSCPKEMMSRCQKTIQKRYHFYLAFENSFSEDYVTEKVLHALNHDTIPIVYGGADYSR